MSRYVIKMSKTGYMKYISHLDMMRLFKNAFKRAGIRLVHSQGFNPHPKMGFAQPLSLGYSSVCELLEFESKETLSPCDILNRMTDLLPEGIKLYSCDVMEGEGKSLAARTVSAQYKISIPTCEGDEISIQETCRSFLDQEKIMIQKKSKKMNKSLEVDIRPMIRDLSGSLVDNNIILYTLLDSGSNSNLSPELFIDAFLRFMKYCIDRAEIEVERTALHFG